MSKRVVKEKENPRLQWREGLTTYGVITTINVESNGTYVPVERYTVDEYCKALTENYKQDTMRSHERSIMKEITQSIR